MIWQFHTEYRTAIAMVERFDGTMMCQNDLPADGQAQSGATCLGFCFAALNKFIENGVQFTFRNANALICN